MLCLFACPLCLLGKYFPKCEGASHGRTPTPSLFCDHTD